MLYLTSTPELNQEEADKLKELSKLMNIIPVITKGDHITKDEILNWKGLLNKDADKYGVEWFNIQLVSSKNQIQGKIANFELGSERELKEEKSA